MEACRAAIGKRDAFQHLIDIGQWSLTLPLVVRAAETSVLTLAAMPPGCFDGPAPGTRTLALSSPLLRGPDVRRMQLALSGHGADIRADGILGPMSMRRVRDFRASRRQAATGTPDPTTQIAPPERWRACHRGDRLSRVPADSRVGPSMCARVELTLPHAAERPALHRNGHAAAALSREIEAFDTQSGARASE